MSDAIAVPASPAPQAKPRFIASRRLHRLAYPLLAVLCLMLWLPGILSLPALDRDESRFAQSSRQMLDSGNFVDIRFGQVPRYKKPVGIYWMQAATTAIAGHAENLADGSDTKIWTYRLPSLIGGIAAVWLTYWAGSALGAEVGLVAALLLGASVLLTAEATIATTDAVLLATVMGVQGVLLRLYRAGAESAPVSKAMVMWGWAAFALGILVKGPVIAGVAAATIAALLVWDWRAKTGMNWTWLKATRPVWGLLLTLLIVLPWLIAIWRESQGTFFQQSLGNDFAAKLAGGQESHGAPPGYNLVLSAIALWPAILFVAPGIALGILRAKEPVARFLLAWAASWWVVCEAVPTKLPHYVLPAYPALAILAALWVLVPRGRDAALNPPWRKALSAIAILQFLAGLGAVAIAPLLLPRLYGGGDPTPVLIGLAAAGAVIGLGAMAAVLMSRRLTAMSLALLSALILIPSLTLGAGPRLTDLWVSQKLKSLVAKDARPGDPPPALAGFEEPSLVFALGADVNLTDGQGAAKLGADFGGLALIDDYEQPKFLARLAELQSDAMPVDEVRGFNYSRGKKVHITIYRVRKLNDTAPSAR